MTKLLSEIRALGKIDKVKTPVLGSFCPPPRFPPISMFIYLPVLNKKYRKANGEIGWERRGVAKCEKPAQFSANVKVS